jgi:hypothetical protein
MRRRLAPKSRRLSKKFAEQIAAGSEQRASSGKLIKILTFNEAHFELINWHRRRYCPKGFHPPYTLRRIYEWTYLYVGLDPTSGQGFCV